MEHRNLQEEMEQIKKRNIKPPSKIAKVGSLLPVAEVPQLIWTEETINGLIDEYYDGDTSIATSENLSIIADGLSRLHRDGYHSTLITICDPKKCTIANRCPLIRIKRAPVGKPCFIEYSLIEAWKIEYTEAVCQRLDLDIEDLAKADIITRNLIMDLIENAIMELRANSTISVEGLFQEVPHLVSAQTGEVWYKVEEHVASLIKDKVKKRRDIIYKQLLATPEMRAKYSKATEKKDSAIEFSKRVVSVVDKFKTIAETNLPTKNNSQDVSSYIKEETPKASILPEFNFDDEDENGS